MQGKVRKFMAVLAAQTLVLGTLAGCGQAAKPAAAAPAEPAAAAPAEPAAAPAPAQPEEVYEEEDFYEDGDYEEDLYAEEEGDEGEGTFIADGEYVTDAEYTGELSSDGKVMTIDTALSEYVNSAEPSYPKAIYVINVADDCKCVQFMEDTVETSFFESMDLINDFLEGKSGLPITLVFQNNELVEIQFSS